VFVIGIVGYAKLFYKKYFCNIMSLKNIIIFASGNGSNAQAIVDYFKKNELAKVVLIICNNPNAFVLQRAISANIPSATTNRKEFYQPESISKLVQQYRPDLIVLAGFLWMMPKEVIAQFPKQIINIHPALLPKFGGKGMYGINVHKAVIAAGERDSGITIHYVNEKYDEGEIIATYKCMIGENETAQSLQQKINQLEIRFYPKVIANLIAN
jgi:phosphoribosylglycinamide formyltransferase 1